MIGEHLLDNQQLFNRAVVDGDFETIEWLSFREISLNQRIDSNGKVAHEGKEPLLWLAERGEQRIIHDLLSMRINGQLVIDTRVRYNGETALDLAAKNDHVNLVAYFLSCTENGNHVFGINECESALNLASEHGKLDVVKVLLSAKGLDGKLLLDAKLKGSKALRLACHNGHTSIVEYLIGLGVPMKEASVDNLLKDPTVCGPEVVTLVHKYKASQTKNSIRNDLSAKAEETRSTHSFRSLSPTG